MGVMNEFRPHHTHRYVATLNAKQGQIFRKRPLLPNTVVANPPPPPCRPRQPSHALKLPLGEYPMRTQRMQVNMRVTALMR